MFKGIGEAKVKFMSLSTTQRASEYPEIMCHPNDHNSLPPKAKYENGNALTRAQTFDKVCL